MPQWLLAVLALATGALIPFQLAFNGQLGVALKSTYLGAFFVFAVGVVAMVAVLLVSRQALPGTDQLAAVPATAWLGGLIATLYILAVVFLVPRLGVGSTAVLVIAGQLVAALALDHFGLFGSAQVSITGARLAGAVLALAGAALVKFA